MNDTNFRQWVTLGIGLLGGLIACALSSPIPWLLGSLTATVIAGWLGLDLVPISRATSRWLRIIIGVSLGGFIAESLGQFSMTHSVAAAFALLFTALITGFGAWFFHKTLRFDGLDSFISALPGGLSFIISLAGDLGKRFPRIGLIHTVRVVVLVFSFSLLSILLGATLPDLTIKASLAFSWNWELIYLFGLILVSGWLADHAGLAGGHVIFGLLLSTVAYKTGLISLPMPELCITLSMVFLGALLGVEFSRLRDASYLRMMSASVGYTFCALVFAGVMALFASRITDGTFLLYLLALAPGGIAEISLITLALGLDAGLVAMVHACRFFLIMLIGPIGLNYSMRKP